MLQGWRWRGTCCGQRPGAYAPQPHPQVLMIASKARKGSPESDPEGHGMAHTLTVQPVNGLREARREGGFNLYQQKLCTVCSLLSACVGRRACAQDCQFVIPIN